MEVALPGLSSSERQSTDEPGADRDARIVERPPYGICDPPDLPPCIARSTTETPPYARQRAHGRLSRRRYHGHCGVRSGSFFGMVVDHSRDPVVGYRIAVAAPGSPGCKAF